MKHTKQIIETAYAALERACTDYHGDIPGRLFERLVCVATAQERQHRRFTRGKYRSAIKLAAQYFVVRCAYTAVVDNVPSDMTSHYHIIAHIATLREDYQIGAMLGAYLRTNAALPTLPEGFNAIDYARDLV